MANDNKLIPAVWSAGSFVAEHPFSIVVDENTFYTVVESRSIEQVQASKANLYEMIFKPVGVDQEEMITILTQAIATKAVVITLKSKNQADVHVLSNYLKSFPTVDGTIYERMALVVNLGPLPPEMKDSVNAIKRHIDEYVASQLGVNANTRLGTIPLRSWTSAKQHELNEVARKAKIKESETDIEKIVRLEREVADLKITVKDQETWIKELSKK